MISAFKNIKKEILRYISLSELSLKIADTWFTDREIFNAIIDKLQNKTFKVELIVLNDVINNKRRGLNFRKLIDFHGDFYYSDSENMVHDKCCIIHKKTVNTGSYNWTYYAENRNWENINISHDPVFIQSYLNEFDRIIESHLKVELIILNARSNSGLNSLDYVKTDYEFQAQNEILEGNKINGLQVYNDLLKLSLGDLKLEKIRTELITDLSLNGFEVCPFELGIKYKDVYIASIPANSSLPITVVKLGKSSVTNAATLKITIQKFDYSHSTITEFVLWNLSQVPKTLLSWKSQ